VRIEDYGDTMARTFDYVDARPTQAGRFVRGAASGDR
jgi:hypothetical protein